MTGAAPRLFAESAEIRARALLLGESLDLLHVDTRLRLAGGPPVLPAGESGCVVLLRYGVVVTYGLGDAEETAFLAQVARHVRAPLPKPRFEEMRIMVEPGREEAVETGQIKVGDLRVETLQVVADILGKSVALDHYEQTVGGLFDAAEALAVSMAQTGELARRDRDLVRHIGNTLLIQERLVGRVEVSEKPEVLWDHPQFERLHQRLDDEFEIAERQRALERKLALVGETAQTVLGLLYNRRSLRVEWYIVALIVFEIALTLLVR
jgi:uncharacterized Rmd1/YagE family protein